MLNANSQILSTEKGVIEYAIFGHGPVVVGMHGAPGGYDQVICLGENLAKKGFELIGWSRPGYLRTPLSVGKTMQEQADALAILLDHLLIDKVSILAISAGGPSALEFAARYPDRISALIMEAAITKSYSPKALQENLTFLKLLLSDFGLWIFHWMFHLKPKQALKKFLSYESQLSDEELDQLVKQALKDPKKTEFISKLMQSFSPMSRRKDGFWNDLEQLKNLEKLPFEKIRCPTLIIHGTADKDVPIDHAQLLSQNLPQAEFYPIEKGTHLLNLSDTFSDMEERVCGFLKKHT